MGLGISMPSMKAQSAVDKADSTAYVSLIRLADYLDGVLQYHPVALQSDLLTEQARAVLRSSRGGFDPKLYGDYDDKYFKGRNYWRIFDGGLSMKTRLGIELKGGFVFQDGDFLNPERSIPSDGQLLLGAKVPIGQGLIIDARRAALKQAQIFEQSNQIERWLQLNDLLFEASIAYWEWSLASAQQRLFSQALGAAEERFLALKNTFFAGDAAGIDTVEAFTQVQQFTLLEREASLETEMKKLLVETFLWNPTQDPISLPDSVEAVFMEELVYQDSDLPEDLTELLSNLDQHPELQKIRFKLASLEIDRKFKADKLKPKLDLNYNLLSNSLGGEDLSSTYSLSPQNYKWGVNFSYPLFLRKERGELAQTRIKIRDTQFYQKNKQQELRNKILAYAEQERVLEQQVQRIAIQVENYRLLYEGEIQKFEAGESTLFLINSRQQKLIEAEQKQLDLEFKWIKARTYLNWVRGLLYTPT